MMSSVYVFLIVELLKNFNKNGNESNLFGYCSINIQNSFTTSMNGFWNFCEILKISAKQYKKLYFSPLLKNIKNITYSKAFTFPIILKFP